MVSFVSEGERGEYVDRLSRRDSGRAEAPNWRLGANAIQNPTALPGQLLSLPPASQPPLISMASTQAFSDAGRG
jgi:hypothetical protein